MSELLRGRSSFLQLWNVIQFGREDKKEECTLKQEEQRSKNGSGQPLRQKKSVWIRVFLSNLISFTAGFSFSDQGNSSFLVAWLMIEWKNTKVKNTAAVCKKGVIFELETNHIFGDSSSSFQMSKHRRTFYCNLTHSNRDFRGLWAWFFLVVFSKHEIVFGSSFQLEIFCWFLVFLGLTGDRVSFELIRLTSG